MPKTSNKNEDIKEVKIETQESVDVTNMDNEKLLRENLELKEQMNKFTDMFASMQKQIENLQTANNSQNNVTKIDDSEEMVYFGSNIMGKTELITDYRSGSGITVYGHKPPISTSKQRMLQLLENDKIRRLFEKGLLYFSFDKWYKVFGIHTNFILDDKNIITLLGMTPKDLMNQLREITDNGKNSPVVHTLIFRIAYLLQNNKVPDFKSQNMQTIKEFFGVDVSDTMRLLEMKSME